MTNAKSKTTKIEQIMIMDDIRFYCDIVQLFENENLVGHIVWGLIPYFSLFIIESNQYLGKQTPEVFRKMNHQHERIIRASRTRIKLLEDNRNDFKSLIKHLDWISGCYRYWFIDRHKGISGLVRRFLHPDLSLTSYSGHIIGTSQICMFNLGLGASDVNLTETNWFPNGFSELGHSVALDIGRYIGQIVCGFDLVSYLNDGRHPIPRINGQDFKVQGAKSDKYYNSIFNGAGSSQINAFLLLLLATINFIEYVLNRLTSGTSNSLFKLKYITIYHVVNSLKKLQSIFYKAKLTRESRENFRCVFEDRELTKLISNPGFRNILVHYSIDKVPEASLNDSHHFFGLIEHFFPGNTFSDINAATDRQLKRLSGILENWHGRVPPFGQRAAVVS